MLRHSAPKLYKHLSLAANTYYNLTAIAHLHQLLYPHIPMVKMNPKIGTFGLKSRVFKAHFHPLKDYETGYVLASTMANI